MPLSTGEFAYARSWIGDADAETDQVFLERFERHYLELDDHASSLASAIEESLRSQLTALTQSPASISIPGGLTASFGQNMQVLQDTIKKFKSSASSVVSFVRVERPSTR